MRLNELMTNPEDFVPITNTPKQRKYGEIKNYSDEEIENVLNFIDKHCSKFIISMKNSGKYLYRGIDHYNLKSIFHGITPTQRDPIGMSYRIQDTLDNILLKGGFQARRKNSICCTSDRVDVGRFGDAFFIFPINGFNYTWSTKINDFGSDVGLHIEIHNNSNFKKFINDFKVQNNTRLPAALLSGHEIMINGQYIALDYEWYKTKVEKHFEIKI